MVEIVKSRADLILRVLEILGITSENRPAYPNEIVMVDKVVDGLVRDLAIRQITYIGNVDEIDVGQFEPLARLLANQAAQPFGVPALEPVGIVPAKDYWEQQLVDQGYGRPSYAPLQIDYF